jgi:hypothetical protein
MTAVTRKPLLRHKGRSGGDTKPFAMLSVEVLTSDAVRTLPHLAHRVLVAVAAQYHGCNNGSLSLTRRTAREYGIGNTHTLAAALRELEERGLIRRTRPGSRIPPRSAFYAVEWLRIDEPLKNDPYDGSSTQTASDRWRQWVAAKRSPHWTITRRSARWRRATQRVAQGHLGRQELSGARPLKRAGSRVAQGHGSDISGAGAV